ncbi:MAG: hypothetical protein WCF44_14505 [Candidatus Methylophosphatis roskildensis]
MLVAASAVTKLATAVEASAHDDPDLPADLSEQHFLDRATEHDPSLLDALKRRNYRIRTLRRDGHAVVLVCNPAGTTALIEDAGCTGPSDFPDQWRTVPPRPCEFTIEPATFCPTAGE